MFTEPAVRLRIAITAALVCYLAGMVVTGFVSLPPSLDVPFALGGWLFLGGLLVWANLRRRRYSSRVVLRAIIWPLPLAAAFGVLFVIVSYFALAWHVPTACTAGSLNCFKGYHWSIQDGNFFHVMPDGSSAQISRDTYIAEVGTNLRSAAGFGVYSLLLEHCDAKKRPPSLDRARAIVYAVLTAVEVTCILSDRAVLSPQKIRWSGGEIRPRGLLVPSPSQRSLHSNLS